LTREIHVQKFRDALSRLEERYHDYVQYKDWVPAFLVESLKESCIQRFAMCFDTAWKHMKKYLEEQLGNVDLPKR
jgi:galactokinase/mevalonate kinase-like predicted kinase